MGARSGEQFLQGLRKTKRELWLEGRRVDDVTAHPALAGGAQTLAGIFDRLHAFPDECLVPDPLCRPSTRLVAQRLQFAEECGGAYVGEFEATLDQ